MASVQVKSGLTYVKQSVGVKINVYEYKNKVVIKKGLLFNALSNESNLLGVNGYTTEEFVKFKGIIFIEFAKLKTTYVSEELRELYLRASRTNKR